MSCTAVSTENNSGKLYQSLLYNFYLAVKTLESKHPKFMRTIEEYGVGSAGQAAYNNILSASMSGGPGGLIPGQRKSGGMIQSQS